MEVIQLDNISKSYGPVKAVKQFSLSVRQGEVLGILGPNGSGKTTTLAIILGLIRQDSGQFLWYGLPGLRPGIQRIGSLIETPNFYPYLSIERNLRITAEIKNVPETEIGRVLGVVGLSARRKSKFVELSLGMKQRLALSALLLGDPEVLILDEPANGLDPEGIAEIREIILAEARKNKTILMASHILNEVEKVCNSVAILKKGELIAHGKVMEILCSEDTIVISGERLNELHYALVRSGLTKTAEKHEFDIFLTLADKITPAELNEFVFKNGFVLSKLEIRKKSLESHFLELIK